MKDYKNNFIHLIDDVDKAYTLKILEQIHQKQKEFWCNEIIHILKERIEIYSIYSYLTSKNPRKNNIIKIPDEIINNFIQLIDNPNTILQYKLLKLYNNNTKIIKILKKNFDDLTTDEKSNIEQYYNNLSDNEKQYIIDKYYKLFSEKNILEALQFFKSLNNTNISKLSLGYNKAPQDLKEELINDILDKKLIIDPAFIKELQKKAQLYIDIDIFSNSIFEDKNWKEKIELLAHIIKVSLHLLVTGTLRYQTKKDFLNDRPPHDNLKNQAWFQHFLIKNQEGIEIPKVQIDYNLEILHELSRHSIFIDPQTGKEYNFNQIPSGNPNALSISESWLLRFIHIIIPGLSVGEGKFKIARSNDPGLKTFNDQDINVVLILSPYPLEISRFSTLTEGLIFKDNSHLNLNDTDLKTKKFIYYKSLQDKEIPTYEAAQEDIKNHGHNRFIYDLSCKENGIFDIDKLPSIQTLRPDEIANINTNIILDKDVIKKFFKEHIYHQLVNISSYFYKNLKTKFQLTIYLDLLHNRELNPLCKGQHLGQKKPKNSDLDFFIIPLKLQGLNLAIEQFIEQNNHYNDIIINICDPRNIILKSTDRTLLEKYIKPQYQNKNIIITTKFIEPIFSPKEDDAIAIKTLSGVNITNDLGDNNNLSSNLFLFFRSLFEIGSPAANQYLYCKDNIFITNISNKKHPSIEDFSLRSFENKLFNTIITDIKNHNLEKIQTNDFKYNIIFNQINSNFYFKILNKINYIPKINFIPQDVYPVIYKKYAQLERSLENKPNDQIFYQVVNKSLQYIFYTRICSIVILASLAIGVVLPFIFGINILLHSLIALAPIIIISSLILSEHLFNLKSKFSSLVFKDNTDKKESIFRLHRSHSVPNLHSLKMFEDLHQDKSFVFNYLEKQKSSTRTRACSI